MSDRHASAPADAPLLQEVQALLDNPAYADNPLRPSLVQLLELNQQQQERLRRLVRISDGYHGVSRNQNQTLMQQYDRQLHRLEKLARISDRYQNSLREVSEALREASLRDPLTDLGNRRFLMERLKEETERAYRKATPYTLGILDVDYFKTVNDRYGHEAGDKVLCEIALAIQEALRTYDLCGRWGGEEFLIVLPDTLMAQANPVAERILQDIKQIQLDFMQGGVSASMGLTVYQSGESYSSTLKRADDALRRAKAAGRDRLEIA